MKFIITHRNGRVETLEKVRKVIHSSPEQPCIVFEHDNGAYILNKEEIGNIRQYFKNEIFNMGGDDD